MLPNHPNYNNYNIISVCICFLTFVCFHILAFPFRFRGTTITQYVLCTIQVFNMGITIFLRKGIMNEHGSYYCSTLIISTGGAYPSRSLISIVSHLSLNKFLAKMKYPIITRGEKAKGKKRQKKNIIGVREKAEMPFNFGFVVLFHKKLEPGFFYVLTSTWESCSLSVMSISIQIKRKKK